MRTEPVLATEGLTVRFDGVAAVDDVNFTLHLGQLQGLIGPNGAGKSTLFKAITGIVRPSSGRIWLMGQETTRMQPHAIARLGIGIKTQVPSLLQGLSVRENIWIVARRLNNARKTAQVVDRLVEQVGLTDEVSQVVETMAHGRRQLVEFATVLAASPAIVLLDEPAAGLSDEEVERFAELLKNLEHDLALLIIEHNLKFVRMVANELTVLHRGRILASGDTDAVLDDERVRDVYHGKEAIR